jgi:CBS domain-containing protein
VSARELAEPYPYVTTDEDAAQALRLLALHRLTALLVVDADANAVSATYA